MRTAVIALGLTIVFSFAGCAFLNKVAPSQVDSYGNAIAGTHGLSPISKDAAGAIPYGSAAVGVFLLVWNFFEKVKANKNEAGLKATVLAIEQAAQDPAIKDAVVKIKDLLSNAHQIANVQPLIDDILAEIKTKYGLG
jgi:hypothetical protein